jgi:hypothetical protein
MRREVESMRELKLFDAERRPPNWMAHIREGEFALFFKDASSGQEMKSDGRYAESGEASTCLIAESLDEALDFAQARVDASPRLRCDIYDERGKANPPLAVIVHHDHKGQENTEALGWKRIRWGIVLIPIGIPLIFYDWRHDWALILPAFFGINLIAAGARMIVWGMGTLENSRRSATFVRDRAQTGGKQPTRPAR